MANIDISKINLESGPPTDEKMIELLKQAYQGEINCYMAVIKIEAIKPFSDFKPDPPENFVKLFEEKVGEGQPLPLYVYQDGEKFIMSDDYNSYFQYLRLGFKEAVCIVLGEPSGEAVLQKSEPFKLPPPTAEVV